MLLSKKLDMLIDLTRSNQTEADIYTTASLARKLNVCTRIIQKWRDSGSIEYFKKGRKILFTGEQVNKFLETYSMPAYRKEVYYGK